MLMIVLVLLTGGAGLWQLFIIDRVIDDAHGKELQRAWSLELLASGYRLIAALDHMLLTEDPFLASTEVAVSLGNLSFYIEILQESGGEIETLGLVEEMQVAYDELRQAVNEVDVLARQELWTEMSVAMEQKVKPANERLALLIRRLVRQADQDAEAVALRTQLIVRQAILLLTTLLVVTTGIALGWRQFVFRDLSLSITELRQGVARISSGDLEYELDVRTGDEIEELSDEFNKMADELANVIGSLERRVTERTRSLQTAAEVSRAITSVLDPEELLNMVVNLARERFNLYYVGLFLVDDAGTDAGERFAVLRAGTGEAGQKMLELGHKLGVGGESMIGQCIARGEARIALDVGEEAVRFNNPLLPETRSELALPLHSRDRVIGAMTVQSVEASAFDEAYVAILQTMADQVAVAIDNARLFANAQATLEEMETIHQRYLGQAWAKYTSTRATIGYEQIGTEMVPLGHEQLPQVQLVATAQRPVIWRDKDQSEEQSPSTLTVPILLRGQPIGALGFKEADGNRQWSADDVTMAETIAEQLALAMDNLRLLDETQRRAAQERLIGDVAARVRETLDMETMLKTAAQEIRQALGLPEMTIRLAPQSADKGGNGAETQDAGEQDNPSPYRGQPSDGGNDA